MASFLLHIVTGLKWLILIDAVLSWVMPDADKFPRNVTAQITEPLYAPIRAVLKPERTGGIDLSPMILLLVLYVMETMLARVTP
jgi:YggT family protein